jgi:hypothetical protein
MRISGPKREEVAGGWRRLQNKVKGKVVKPHSLFDLGTRCR